MKARLCFGFAVIMFLTLRVSNTRSSQVNAADVQSGDPGGSWVSEYISTEPDAGSHVSIAFDEENSNRPWIAYYNNTNGSLMVTHLVGSGNGDCPANDDWVCEEVDTGDVGLYNSIDVYPDTDPDPFKSTWKVGVSYYDATNRSLKYAEHTCIAFICRWDIQTVQTPYDAGDPAASVGKYSSLKFDDEGTAYLSYYESDPGNGFINEWMVYANNRVSIRSCGADDGWSCVDIDGEATSSELSNFGTHTSLDLDYQGHVWISYYDGKNGDLLLAFCDAGSNCDFCDEWDKWLIDDGGGDDTGLFTSLHALQRPEDVTSIAYYNRTSGELNYASYRGFSGNCGPDELWWCELVDSVGAGFSRWGLSLAVSEDGMPLIAYMDGSEELAPLGLKVASPAYLQPDANCGSGYYTWYCREVDNGAATQEEAEFLALGIKPNGLAMISYSERDTYAFPEKYNLKIAYQTATTLLPLVVK